MRTERGSAGNTGLIVGVIAVLIALGVFLPKGHDEPKTADFAPMSSPAKPVRLVVPALHLRAAVKPIALGTDGVLDPPGNVKQVGWWQDSARIGRDSGQTVLTGHTVHTGGGVMDHLGKLRRGMRVMVTTPKGTMTYVTTRVLTLTKAQISQRAVELFGQKRSANRLVLVTCTGWTGKEYTSNIVAFARPLGVRQAS